MSFLCALSANNLVMCVFWESCTLFNMLEMRANEAKLLACGKRLLALRHALGIKIRELAPQV